MEATRRQHGPRPRNRNHFPQMNRFTGRQWRILVVLASCNFLAATVQSLQAPFYPAEAQRKGASPSEFGLVFGVYELVAFLVCPVISNFFHRFKHTTAFFIGYSIVAVSTTLFGFLDRIDGHIPFIALSFALRILESFGGTIVFISNYTFVTISFPASIATVFAIMETMFAVGIAAGPAYGEFLFQLGGANFGFTLPFVVTGCLLFLSNLVAIQVLTSHPRGEPVVVGDSSGDEPNFGFFTLLKSPTVGLYAASIVSSSLCAGFLLSTLEPHLRQFSLTPVQVGLVFLIYGGVYAVMASGWGIICDRSSHPEYVPLVGALFILASFTTVGPVFFLPIDSSVILTGTSLAVLGLGTSAINVSAFLLILQQAKQNGFPDNTATSAAVTGLWLSSMSLGGFIGPSLGGILFDAYGFRTGTVFNVGLFIIISLLHLGSILAKCKPLLSSSTADSSERCSLLSSRTGSTLTNQSDPDVSNNDVSKKVYIGGYQRI